MDIGTIEDDDFIQIDEESDSEEEKTVNKRIIFLNSTY